MATTIPQHYTTEFGKMWEHRVQQMESRLKAYVSVDSITGKEKSYNQLASVTANLITTRIGPTVGAEQDQEKRWIRLQGYDHVTLFDEFDERLLGEVPLPDSETVNNHAMAFERQCDQTIIDAMAGTNYVGATGVTAASAAAVIPADYKDLASTSGGGTDYNLTIQKLVRARQLLEEDEAYDPRYGDQLCIMTTANQVAGLLSDAVHVQSSDYNAIKALYEGQIDTYGGFKWIRLELLPLVSGSSVNRRCFAWVKSGVKLGISTNRSVRASIRDDLNEARQIRTKMMLGATRMQEEKVKEIICAEDKASTV